MSFFINVVIKEIILGFSCGIIGLPNAGKSTLFNALTASHVPAENYPFCTKEKNVGVVSVSDTRLPQISRFAPREKLIATTIEFVDIAGLVKGASQGEGLGNQFLSHVAEVDAIAHVVRCFDRGDVVHLYGSVHPIRDIEIVNTELLLRDQEILGRWLSKNEKAAKSGSDRKLKESVSLVLKLAECLNRAIPIAQFSLSEEEKTLMKELRLGTLTSKPVLYVANISEEDLKNPSPALKELEQWFGKQQYLFIRVSSQVEAELVDLKQEEREDFMKELGMAESGLVQLIRKGYELLGLITFFTIGDKEIRAWTVPQGTRAPQAAGKIHSDFERGFIAAETIRFTDFAACRGEQASREQGKVRLEGREYQVQDGDIIQFRFNG